MGRFVFDLPSPWPDATEEDMVDLMFGTPPWAAAEESEQNSPISIGGDER